MVILSNGKRTIQFSISDTIYDSIDGKNYISQLPVVICSKRSDAEYIQQKVNEYIHEISNELLAKRGLIEIEGNKNEN